MFLLIKFILMIFEQKVPGEPLDAYISSIVYYKDYKVEHEKDKFLPDCTANLVIELGDVAQYIFDNQTLDKKQKCEEAWFSGMHTEYLTLSSGNEAEMMVVTFKAGGAFSFIQKGVDNYINKVVPASSIFGRGISEMREEIKTINSPEEKIGRIEYWLQDRLNDSSFSGEVIDHFINEIQNASGVLNFKQIASESGYSQKQFIHLFKKHVGLSPKQFHRIVRFNEIIKRVHLKEKVDWIGVATDCGYYDQSHFIKDFQAFSGLNPKKYIEDQGDFPHYVPIR